LTPQGAAFLARATLRVTEIPLKDGPPTHRLGAVLRAEKDSPAHIILFRRPIERVAGGREFQAEVIYRTLVELIAELAARPPHGIDPNWCD
ncbi:MAG: metallopeptidase family protein, partial [Angustibacter sp.]